MGNRSIWSGTIAFGMVVIPVKLYTAVSDEREDLVFHQVRQSDGSRIQYRRVAAADGQEVSYAEIAKGLVWGEHTVVLSDADMADLPVPSVKQIKIEQFADPDEVDPLLFDKSYFVVPDKGGEHAYRLLRRAMRGQAGIGRVTLRSRERVAVLSVRPEGILLTTIQSPSDIREFPKYDKPVVDATQDHAEFMMALQIVHGMTRTFEADAYPDRWAEAVRKLAEERVSGVKAEPAKPTQGEQVTSLMEALKASVAASKTVAAQ